MSTIRAMNKELIQTYGSGGDLTCHKPRSDYITAVIRLPDNYTVMTSQLYYTMQ